MTVYQAANALGVWTIIKARAEVWSVSNIANIRTVNNLKIIIKNKFHELAMDHHPDKQGDHNIYLMIKEAYEIIKNANVQDFIDTLKDEQEKNKQYFEPGSLDCKQCTRWNDTIGLCLTVSCSGLKLLKNQTDRLNDQ